MRVVICGGGKVGLFLAKELSIAGHHLVLIEKSATKCAEIAEALGDALLVILGDACEPRILDDAGLDHADVMVAVTGDDEDNLIICQLAKSSFKVARTIARVNDPRNQYTMAKLGVDNPVNSTAIIAQMINQEVSLDEISTLLKLKQGKVSVLQRNISAQSVLCNMAIRDIKLPEQCIIATVLRKGEVLIPRGDTILQENDEILALMDPHAEREFLSVIKENKS